MRVIGSMSCVSYQNVHAAKMGGAHNHVMCSNYCVGV